MTDRTIDRKSPRLLRACLYSTLLLAITLAGCDRAPPKPVAHVQLHVAADGSLQLDHQPVRTEDLGPLLAQRQAGTPPLMVEIHASPKADMQVVQAAAHAVEAAHARVSYTDEFPASDPGDGQTH